MKVSVVYDRFGNTEQIAQAIGAALELARWRCAGNRRQARSTDRSIWRSLARPLAPSDHRIPRRSWIAFPLRAVGN